MTAGSALRTVLAVTIGAGALLLGPATAARADTLDAITRYDVDVAVHADGTAHVREAITYDFEEDNEHGIYRKLRYAVPAGDDRDQAISVSGIRASSDAPDELNVSDDGAYKLIKIGDPAQEITGVHTYVIEYDTDHVATSVGGGVRYAWNAVGDEWDVQISNVRVRLSGPATLSTPRCFAGSEGSTDTCDSERSAGTTATFSQSWLDAGEGVTVQADLPKGSVAVAPKYVAAGGLFEGERTTEPALPGAITIGVILAAALAIYLYGPARRAVRDRRPVPPGLPDELTPALAAGLLSDAGEREMIIGTLLDLARRGYLRIDDLPGPPEDWMLTRTAEPDPGLAPYERKLMTGLFTRREEVKISRLRNRFGGTSRALALAVNEELVRCGWEWPASLRVGVRAAATPFVVLGILSFVTRPLSGYPYIGSALLVLAFVIVVPLAGRFRLTRRGEDARRQVKALRERLLDPTGFAEDVEWAVPYAAVAGRASRWQKAMDADRVPHFSGYTGGSLGNLAYIGGAYMISTPSPPRTKRLSSIGGPFRGSGLIGGSAGGGGSYGGGFSGGSVGGGGGGGGGGSW